MFYPWHTHGVSVKRISKNPVREQKQDIKSTWSVMITQITRSININKNFHCFTLMLYQPSLCVHTISLDQTRQIATIDIDQI